MRTKTIGRILKANLECWRFKRNFSTLLQVYPWLYSTSILPDNSDLNTWSLALSAKKKDKNTDEKMFASPEFDFFEFSSSLLLEYCRVVRTRISISYKMIPIDLDLYFQLLSSLREATTNANSTEASTTDLKELQDYITLAEKLEIPAYELKDPYQTRQRLNERLNLVNRWS